MPPRAEGPARPVEEVEVERLPDEGDAPPASAAAGPRAGSPATLPPWLFGVVIDGLDVATRGPRWAVPGFFLGVGVGYFLARRTGMAQRSSVGLALLCGAYCGLPGTWPVPLGTVVGVYRTLFPAHGGRAR